jgi:hypothetical protein
MSVPNSSYLKAVRMRMKVGPDTTLGASRTLYKIATLHKLALRKQCEDTLRVGIEGLVLFVFGLTIRCGC